MDGIMAKQDLKKSDEIAELFGFSVRRVEQLAKDGIIPAAQKRPYMFDLVPTIKTYVLYLSEKANSKEKACQATDIETQKLQAETDLKRSKADISALQLEELEGKMHRSEDVEEMTTDLVHTVRSMIMALPGRLAVDVTSVGTAAEASIIIRKECYKILDELSSYKYDPEAYRRRVREREGWSELLADEDDN